MPSTCWLRGTDLPTAPLSGWRVLVTRPGERAAGLAEAIAAAGGRPLVCPTLAFEPLVPAAFRERLDGFDLVVFVSPAAVDFALPHLDRAALGALALGAVGRATAERLRASGLAVAVEPASRQDSEGLLAVLGGGGHSVAGQRVLIVRGRGGRARLGRGLAAGGAAVSYLEVYRRVLPADFDGELAACADIVTVTSEEGLERLLAALDREQRATLQRCPVATISERLGACARRAGFAAAIATAAGPGDAELTQAVVELAQRARTTDTSA